MPYLRALQRFCGFRVRIRGDTQRIKSATVIIANHVSQLDGLPFAMIQSVRPRVLVRTTYRDYTFAHAVLSTLADPIFVPPPSMQASEKRIAHDRVQRQIRQHLSKRSGAPLVCFPEGSITNGKGLMRFERFVFGLGHKILPAVIRVQAPFPLALDTIWSPLPMNIARMLFQPWHVFDVQLLPSMEARGDETAESFARRAQLLIAEELHVPATSFSTADKAAAINRLKSASR